jgi:phosphatidate cytidylyltransferase
MDRNLAQRVGFAVVAIPLALAVVWVGGWLLVALVAVVAVLGTRELYGLARRTGVLPFDVLGLATAAAVPPLVYLGVTRTQPGLGAALPYAAALWMMLVLTVGLATRGPSERPLAAAATTLFGVGYAALLPAFLIDLRHAAHPGRSWAGAALVFYPLVVTWVCDTAAMFGGRTIGGPKLAPTVSPGKTRAGAVAGVVGALLVAPLFGTWVFPQAGVTAPLATLLMIAAVLSVVGQIGDLAESVFKREAGVKDSSALIPGHGGVLDRFDSLYFVVPVAAVLYRALGVR